jgi:hypothetical protein
MINVNTLAAVFNVVNILLCIGMVVYSVKWLRLFRGGKFQRAIEALVASVCFFLTAAIARAALIWNIFPTELQYVDIFIRFFAFLFLFSAIALIVRQWTNLGK